jgi:hypothetical protein
MCRRRSVEHRRDAHHPVAGATRADVGRKIAIKCDRRRREQVGKAIDKSLIQSPRRYPLSIFFINVNHFTLVAQMGSDDANREASQGVARRGPVPIGLFDPNAIWGATSWKRAKKA